MFKNVWFVTDDWCGLFCANLTLFLLLGAEFVIIKVILWPWQGIGIHALAYTVLTTLAIVSHTRCQYTDPGAVPQVQERPVLTPLLKRDNDSNETVQRQNGGKGGGGGGETHTASENGDGTNKANNVGGENSIMVTSDTRAHSKSVCARCKSVKPTRAHHCRTCMRCIMKMDHHCPWVNNCVAMFNQKYFLLFLFYTGACSVYAMSLLVSRFLACTGRTRMPSCRAMSGLDVVLGILVVMEAIMFGIFVLVMFCDQMSAIMENTPGIDKLQNRMGEKRTRMDNIRAVFGESFSLRWFLPLALPKKVYEEFKELCGEGVNSSQHVL